MIELLAPAKLTLHLAVTGVRSDGYHLLDAEMVALSLADTLRIGDGPGPLTVRTEGATSGRGAVPVGEENLITRALRLVGRERAVEVTKRIPPGAGLGGGSADAAAVLRWAGYEDLDGASRLGADVPFCLLGGRARVQGIGEVVSPLAPRREELTLFLLPFGVDTTAVYRAFDQLEPAARRGEHGNDLEPAAEQVEPRLARWRDALTAELGRRPRLAGSGSTLFLDGTPEALGLTDGGVVRCGEDVAAVLGVTTQA